MLLLQLDAQGQALEQPLELSFQDQYGDIERHLWFGDGYMLLGFSTGPYSAFTNLLQSPPAVAAAAAACTQAMHMNLSEVICKLMPFQQQDTVVFGPSLTSSMMSNQQMRCGAACCILQHRAMLHVTRSVTNMIALICCSQLLLQLALHATWQMTVW